MRPFVLLVFAACGSAPVVPPTTATGTAPSTAAASAPVAAPPPPSASAAGSTSSAPPPPAMGGSVLIGDIAGPKDFDPKPVLEGLRPKFLDCFNSVRSDKPNVHGKLMLRVVVNEAGKALSADADAGQPAYDPSFVLCLDGVIKGAPPFPKPGGMATIAVPLVFRR